MLLQSYIYIYIYLFLSLFIKIQIVNGEGGLGLDAFQMVFIKQNQPRNAKTEKYIPIMPS